MQALQCGDMLKIEDEEKNKRKKMSKKGLPPVDEFPLKSVMGVSREKQFSSYVIMIALSLNLVHIVEEDGEKCAASRLV